MSKKPKAKDADSMSDDEYFARKRLPGEDFSRVEPMGKNYAHRQLVRMGYEMRHIGEVDMGFLEGEEDE